ncbi:hypothetical protein ACXN5S_16650 [Pseudoroseicyclus sp. H15]
MRDFFIRGLEILVNFLVVAMVVIWLLATVASLFAGSLPLTNGTDAVSQLGLPPFVTALLVFVLGGIYIVVVAGAMYLGLGIYQNTRRTAELLESMAGAQLARAPNGRRDPPPLSNG